jgi:hypothetical protein
MTLCFRCGTNSYSACWVVVNVYLLINLVCAVSPEVIRGHGYSFSCDWWSMGVIMFECLYGYVFARYLISLHGVTLD